jgi:NADPH:quinone reductase-like Zn-dependent oxidoreductase
VNIASIDLLVRRQIQPVIGARVPLTEVGSAHRMLERADVAGKIVRVPS